MRVHAWVLRYGRQRVGSGGALAVKFVPIVILSTQSHSLLDLRNTVTLLARSQGFRDG